MKLMKLSPISSLLNRQPALIPSFCQGPEAWEPLRSLPSQMLGTQPAPAGWRPLPPGAGPLSGRAGGAGQATGVQRRSRRGAPQRHRQTRAAGCCICGRTIAQQGVAGAVETVAVTRAGCGHSLGSGLSAQLLLFSENSHRSTLLAASRREETKSTLALPEKVFPRDGLVKTQGVFVVPDHCLLKWYFKEAS